MIENNKYGKNSTSLDYIKTFPNDNNESWIRNEMMSSSILICQLKGQEEHAYIQTATILHYLYEID
jgi:hypothetical protein